jgi:hypothetical protein
MRHSWVIIALLALAAGPLGAQDTTKALPDDGWPDLSKFLDKPYGFIPVIAPITEPAVGYGAAAALIFIDKRKGTVVDMRHPSITGIGGFATEDGSWGGFGGLSRYGFDHKLKWRAAGAFLKLFLDFYGLSDESPLHDAPISYELTGYGGLLGGVYALGKSGLWAGVDYLLGHSEVDVTLPGPVPPELGEFNPSATLASLRPSVLYDSRNNVFSPIRGLYAEGSASVFNSAWGSDEEFTRGGLVVLGFVPFGPNLYFGIKGEGSSSTDDTPFYLKPFVTLRGVTAQRIQGKQVADAEGELRWQFWGRLSAVGFIGVGGAWSSTEDRDQSSSVVSGGTGIRYEIARKYGIHMGVDVGFGPDDPILYVTFGHAWARP